MIKMIKIILLLFCFTQTSFANVNSDGVSDLKIKISFDQKLKNGKKIAEHNKLENTIQLSREQHDWQSVGKQQSSENGDLFLLLAKIDTADKEKVKLKFLIINNDKKSEYIKESELILSYGKKGKIKFSDENQQTQLSALVSQATI